MANEWTSSGTSACFNASAENIPLMQSSMMQVGKYYFVKITISGSTQGKISIPGFENTHEFNGNSDFSFIDKSLGTDLIINPKSFGAGIFNGCVSEVEVNEVPMLVIKDGEGNIVFTQTDLTGVTANRDFVQYIINWDDFEEGCYFIYLSDSVLDYKSDCLSLKLLHSCSLQLQWKNDEDGFGFDYSGLAFEPTMRVDGELWKWHYKSEDKQVFTFSNGKKKILYVRKYKQEYLTIKELPEYMHDAFAFALDHDNFYIDGVGYIFEEDEVTPNHRKRSDMPSVEVNVVRNNQNLLNSNCG